MTPLLPPSYVQFGARAAALWVALFCVLSLSTGCATAPDQSDGGYINPGTTDLVVERLEIRGVESVSERELRGGLATLEDPGFRARIPWFPIIGAERRYFNRFAWNQDRERIVAYYRQQGFYDAQIVSESVIEDPEAGTVRIRVTIDEGEPTQTTSIDIHGLVEDVTPGRETLLSGLPLSEDDIFVEASYRRTRDSLQSRLRDAGHAYATVTGRVFIDPEDHTAEVFFFAEPGPQTTIGPVYIFGLEDIQEDWVRRAMDLRQGERYSPATLRRAQEDIYDLGVFGMVTVLPAHEARDMAFETRGERRRMERILDEHDMPATPEEEEEFEPDPDIHIAPEEDDSPFGISHILSAAQEHAEARSRLAPEVPIVIRVQEATGYNVRVGAGTALETSRQDVRGILNWSSRNFLGGLRRLEHFNAVGYAWSPNVASPLNRGVILSSELRFQQPQFFERRTNLRLRAALERDVREGFSVWSPSTRIGVDRPFGRYFHVELSYNLAYFNYFDLTGAFEREDTEFGREFQSEFILEHFEQSLTYDRRNDLLNPTAGYMLDLTLQQAGNYVIGGEFDFFKPVVSAEAYVPTDFFTRSLVALRGRIGSAYNVGRDEPVPLQSRLFSGGPDGMRSFGRRRLSLYTDSGDPVPIGGSTQAEVSIEPRFRLVADLLDIGDLWGAVFLDSATVLRSQFLFETEPNTLGTADFEDVRTSLLYGLGTGLWWNTPVGPVRLDFAYTLSDITEDRRFRRCENPENYNTPQCDFVPLEDDPIQDIILGYGVYLSIGHSF